MLPRRHPIHVPYLVDRLRATPPKDLADAVDADALNQSFNQMMGELHRYLRYLQDTSDQSQSNFKTVDGEIESLKFVSISISPVGPAQSPYPVQPGDIVILAAATTAPVTVLLPIALQNKGRRLVVKKIDATQNTVKIAGNGANVDDAVDLDLLLQHEVAEVVSDGTAWWVI